MLIGTGYMFTTRPACVNLLTIDELKEAICRISLEVRTGKIRIKHKVLL